MSAEVFSEAMGLIGEKYIMEAATYQRKKHPVHKVWLSRVAGVLLAILLAGSAVLAFSTEARAAFLGWVRQQIESLYAYVYMGDPVAADPMKYELTEIPEGFNLATIYEIQGGQIYVYINENGIIADFSYTTDPDGFIIYAELVECEHYTVSVNGMSGDLYIAPNDEEANMLIWTDSEKGLFFSISAPLSGEALLELAKTVKITE